MDLLSVDSAFAPERAAALAEQLCLPLRNQSPDSLFRLIYSEQGLQLQLGGDAAPGPVMADFGNAQLAFRLKDAVRKQSIVRAVGIKPGLRPNVIDATAGFGKDAFLLASLGCQLLMTESDVVVAALLQDALQRAGNSSEVKLREAADRMRLLSGDFCDLAASLEPAQVVYLDPMFPGRDKSARVKKEMFVLQQYFAARSARAGVSRHGEDDSRLLDVALEKAQKRVVVKRARHSPTLDRRRPDFTLPGSSSRYDVYLKH